jgi:DNA-binding CsgD family transcriptional regulator
MAVPKDRPALPEGLEQELRKAIARVVDDLLADRAAEHHPSSDATAPDSDMVRKVSQLTPRQLEYIRLACHEKCFTNKQIADRMKVSEHMVDKHCLHVYRKLKVGTRQGLLWVALRYGIVSL